MSIPLHQPIVHDPNARLPYAMDWSEWLTAEADTFVVGLPDIEITPTSSSPIGSPPDDLTVLSSPASAYTATSVIWWLVGGTAGVEYSVRVRIETLGGRRDDRTVSVQVEER